MSATHVIIGTAGHIDHGKTALVKALTGIETDTHPEEQARGVTIDVGFAYWKDKAVSQDRAVTLIDVPGHERFVKNAVAGVSSVDLALFVVAADDGVMPQTREHLAILRLLGVSQGIVALTKIDLVEAEWVELVTEELRELFEGTFLEDAEIVPVSSITGEGIDGLRALLEERIAAAKQRPDRGALRLPVDRAFSMSGFGTVVTGTVLSGTVRTHDELVLQPQGRTVRVRGLQIHGHDQPEAGVGARAAVNLSDLTLADVERGDVVAEPGFYEATYMVDAHLQMLDDAPATLKHRDRVRLHLGPREVLARVVLLDAEVLPPGEAGYVQFRLETPGVAAHRDRFVVRRYSPAQTLGGGFVLDARASKHRRRRPEVLDRLTRLQAEDTTRVVEALLGDAGTQGPGAPDLAHALGRSVSDVEARLQVLRDTGSCTAFEHAGRLRYIATEPWEALSAEIVTALQAFHAAHPLQPGIARELLRRQIGERHDPDVYAAAVETLSSSGPVRADAGRVRLAAHQVELSADQERLRQTVASAVRDGAAQPPDESQLAEKIDSRSEETAAVVAVMLERRELVRLGDNLLFDPHVLEQIRTRLVEFLVEHGQIEVSTFRELVHTTRKYALPLLNFFDSQGLTRRDESVRRLVPGAVDTSAASAGD